VSAELRGHDELADVAAVAAAALRVIDHRIAPGQIADVRDAMPVQVRRLWLKPSRADGGP